MTTVRVVESRSGVRHLVHPAGASWWTYCSRRVPRANGWFGPVHAEATCRVCLRAFSGEPR